MLQYNVPTKNDYSLCRTTGEVNWQLTDRIKLRSMSGYQHEDSRLLWVVRPHHGRMECARGWICSALRRSVTRSRLTMLRLRDYMLILGVVVFAAAAGAQMPPLHVVPIPPPTDRPPGMKDIPGEPDTYLATYIPNVEYVRRNGHPLLLQMLTPRSGPPPLPGMPPPRSGAVAAPKPLIVYVQGSAWMQQDLYGAIPQLSEFAHAGYVVASVQYRPSTEAPAPAQIQDVKTAIRFLRANAAKYGIDPTRVGIWGDSSGGHMAALVATTVGVPEFATPDYADQSDAVKAVVDFYGVSDLTQMARFPSWMDHNAETSPESRLLGGGRLDKNTARAVANSPVHYVARDRVIPPFLIIHGDRDVLVPFNQSVLLYEALQKAGKEATFYRVVGGNHGWDFWTPTVMKLVHDFLDAKLKTDAAAPTAAAPTAAAPTAAAPTAAAPGRRRIQVKTN